MSQFDHVQPVPPSGEPAYSATEPRRERVGLGLLAAAGVLVLGGLVTLLVWKLGFVASITSFAMAFGAVWAYTQVAGSAPRRGLGPLLGLIVLSVVATFFVLVGYDATVAYDELGLQGSGLTKMQFARTAMFDGQVLSSYTRDMLFFFGFAVLGMWSTLKKLLGGRA
ncbi:MAG: hypothetical protein R2731_02415 [Nocardioides sp.]